MKNVQERFEALKSMNTIIKSMNDESAYSAWIWIIPDGADDDELQEIAEEDDETFLYKITTIKIITRKVFKKNHNQNFLKNNNYFNSKYTKPLQSDVYKYKTGKDKIKI